MRDETPTRQRTLVVTVGELAVETGQSLLSHFIDQQIPTDGLTVLPVANTADLNETELDQALLAISHQGLQSDLRQKGWRLDRLDEIALCLVWQNDGHASSPAIARLVQDVERRAQTLLGTAVTTTLIWLDPLGVPLPTAAWQEIANGWRAILVLGVVNELGLRVTDPAVGLADAGQLLLQALLTTPLTTLLDRLSEQVVPLQASYCLTCAVGLGQWVWTPEAWLDLFVRVWQSGILAEWIGKSDEAMGHQMHDGPEKEALREKWAYQWLERFGGTPTAWKPIAFAALPKVASLDWVYQRPWRLRHRAKQLLQQITTSQSDLTIEDEKFSKSLWEQRAHCEQSLENCLQEWLTDDPTCPPHEARDRLVILLAVLQGIQDGLQQQVDHQGEQVKSLDEALKSFYGYIEEELRAWPQGWRQWLRVVLRPWHWWGVGRRYLSLHRLAQGVIQLSEEWNGWQSIHRVTTLMEETIEGWIRFVHGRWSHLDEAHDMLTHLHHQTGKEINRLLADKTATDIDWKQLYDALLVSEVQSGKWAFARLGGLAPFVFPIDDIKLQQALRRIGERYWRDQLDQAAVDLLPHLYPTAEAQAGWWTQLWEAATPLWRFDATEMSDLLRMSQPQTSAVAVAGARHCAAFLSDVDLPTVAWQEHVSDKAVLAMRLRPLPLGDKGQISSYFSATDDTRIVVEEKWEPKTQLFAHDQQDVSGVRSETVKIGEI